MIEWVFAAAILAIGIWFANRMIHPNDSVRRTTAMQMAMDHHREYNRSPDEQVIIATAAKIDAFLKSGK